MSVELVIFTAVFALLGASLVLLPRSQGAGARRGQEPELERLLRPQLLLSTTVRVACC